ncbi:MAG: TonB-dependent receptor, partial [Algoriphagus sp. 32-45-6]
GKIFDSEPGAVLVPNPDLRPEYAYNAEVNFNKTFGSKLKTDFTAFYTLLDQAMVRRPFQLNGQQEIVYDGELSNVLAIQNAAFAQIHGIQAGLEYQIAHHWSITSRYNLQKGVEELDDESRSPSRHAAPAFGLTRITFQKLKFRADLSSSYSAKRDFEEMPQEEKDKTFIYARDENGNSYSPSWMVFNFQFSYQFLEKITVSGGVENISDRQYRPYSSGIVAPGRNFTLTLKADF